VGNDGSSIFDDLGISVAQVKSLGQEFRQPGIHAGEDDHSLVWKAIRDKSLVPLLFHEGTVMKENLTYLAHGITLFLIE
jgi:hypothetical protein